MRCAHCKAQGPDITVAQIKACSDGVEDAHVKGGEPTCKGMFPDSKDLGDPFTREPQWPASDKQIKYVLALQDERQLPEDYNVKYDADLRMMERDEVSGLINLLKTFARREGSAQKRKEWTMPAGRYALYKPGADDMPGAYSYVDRQDLVKPDYGRWMFYEVQKPTDGRWKGYTFIKRLQGAPGAYQKINLTDAKHRDGLLERIEADPKQAMLDYGLQSGVCGRCSSPLTDPESLARGIGPKCAQKSGWF